MTKILELCQFTDQYIFYSSAISKCFHTSTKYDSMELYTIVNYGEYRKK